MSDQICFTECSANSQGPHDITCLRQWWMHAGCSLDGLSSPDNKASNVEWWNARTGHEVKSDMASYFQSSTWTSSNYFKCHGTGKYLNVLN